MYLSEINTADLVKAETILPMMLRHISAMVLVLAHKFPSNSYGYLLYCFMRVLPSEGRDILGMSAPISAVAARNLLHYRLLAIGISRKVERRNYSECDWKKNVPRQRRENVLII